VVVGRTPFNTYILFNVKSALHMDEYSLECSSAHVTHSCIYNIIYISYYIKLIKSIKLFITLILSLLLTFRHPVNLIR
jgi:hypothetical protein